MNETFKTELAAFARDVKAICDANPHTCQHCPLVDADGCCKGGLLNSIFDPEAAIAAVEAYRKRKKPCVEVIDHALDVYTLEGEVERGKDDMTEPVEVRANRVRAVLNTEFQRLYYKRSKTYAVRVLSAKRFVLGSHREDAERVTPTLPSELPKPLGNTMNRSGANSKPPALLNFTFECLAEICDAPCNWSIDGNGLDAYMLEHCGEWCDENCGKISAAECWRKYIETRFKEDE